jgi:preprotein translocase subunit SecD
MAFLTKSLVLLAALNYCELTPQLAVAADPPRVTLEFRRAETKLAEGLSEERVVGSDQKVYVHKAVELTNVDIVFAKPGLSRKSKYEILVRFSKEGAQKMAKLSEAHRGKPLAILVNGKVVCAPVLRDMITEWAAIDGSFTQEEVERICKEINGN